jgi:hypothetical protein
VAAYDAIKATTSLNLDIDPSTVVTPAPPANPTTDSDGFTITGVAAIDALKSPKDIRNFRDYAQYYRGPHSQKLKQRVEEINAKFENQKAWDWRTPMFGGRK